MAENEFETFDFLINDEDEVMLLLYVHEGEPKDAHIELNAEERTAILYRTPEEAIELSDIPAEIFDSLDDADTLMVCELSKTANEDDAEIVHAYEAEIED